ncbi:hypothetical protein FIBSPDRAFT_36119 [Athelia psychrophila]|uniref:Importin N-terminal domain-containing protein n=1 Tax=Athelia psychrophila TaxID=1759441 RepID=A0A166FT13_9AGAM|nr:hypothetical protein FIBSPDRAFT_36119 [Fibularhizoctonia sp. CBS 109695]
MLGAHDRGLSLSSDLSSLLLASLHPASHQAEQNLTAPSAQPGFISALLQLVLGQGTQDRSVRLLVGVYLKHVTNYNGKSVWWLQDINPMPDSDKVELRKALMPAMLLRARLASCHLRLSPRRLSWRR